MRQSKVCIYCTDNRGRNSNDMDKKYIIKVILLNALWLAWIALSVFFGYLIAKEYFSDNIATLIPFSLIFIVVGGAVAFIIYKLIARCKRGKAIQSPATKGAEDGTNALDSERHSSDDTGSSNGS